MSSSSRSTVSKYLIQQGLLLSSSAQTSIQQRDIYLEGNQIVAIGNHLEVSPDVTIVDASGLLLCPGLVNGHFHSHEHFHKGRYDNLPLELWMHFVRPPRQAISLTPEQVYLRTMIGAIEALRTGTTFVVDDVNHAPQFSPACIDAVFRAYGEIGLRARVSVSLFDRPFYRSVPFVDEVMPASIRELLEQQACPDRQQMLTLCQALAETYPPSDRVGFIVAPSAPQRCSDVFLVQLKEFADQHNLPIMMHLLETRLQAVTGGILYQDSMVNHLAKLKVLSPQLALQHCVWLTEDDIAQLADAGVSVVYNPLSNLKLGSGRMAVRRFLEAGVNVALASDGCGSRDSLNLLSVMQAAALLNKPPTEPPETWLSAQEAFRLGTEGGAAAFGYQGQLGRLEVGYQADIVGYRLSSPAFVPLNNPLNQLVYAETGAAVDWVMIDGKVVMQQGQLTQIKEHQIIAAIEATHQQLLPSLSASEESVNALLPYYRQIYDRCLKEPIDPAITAS
ncbi:MAG TPA: amidohydrolase [Trichocoleus sp.]|jgi:guanine deaminase